MSRAYYNEIDAYAAQWLRNLIAAGHIAAGDVDERSIIDVRPDDLRGYTQCHFFAGIGGWSYALRLAGWSDDRPVWTGSCPCQPFSAAGAQRGSDDERHLWPAWFRLIRECRPATVFGEQVAGAAGRAWLGHVLADLEACAYAGAAADLPAASVGGFHIRQRLFFVAHADRDGPQAGAGNRGGAAGSRSENGHDAERRGGLGDAERAGLEGHAGHGDRAAGRTLEGRPVAEAGASGDGLGDTEGRGLGIDRRAPGQAGHADVASSPWADVEWLACSDGKARPTQPGLFPLAHGIPNRVGRLRAYGNAIVPQVAAEFIAAVMECRPKR